MKKPFFQRGVLARRHSERGVTMVLVAIALVAIIAMAALSIDVITLYLARQEAQRAADASALAAARVISLSGMTGDPANTSASWTTICGGPTSPASLAATAVATQSAVGGTVPSTPTVTYGAGGVSGSTDCSTLPAAFGVNPMVTVVVRRASLPTFFSRIWGANSNSVSATATAEAFNPSGSDLVGNGALGSVTPVQPSCVKPWLVPNQNPNQPTTNCNTIGNGPCNTFVSTADGSITNPGVQPTTTTGVIGETFTLFADCGVGSPCLMPGGNVPQANQAIGTFTGGPAPGAPNLQYLPGEAPPFVQAVPACAASGGGGVPEYAPAVAGCDQNTVYHCGVTGTPNVVDLAENPGGPAPTGDTATALGCMIVNDATTSPMTGMDTLDTTAYPYKIRAGSANPAGLNGNLISISNSIVTLPIYDPGPGLTFVGTRANVTIVGFLQVFVNQVQADGSINVTVLNVSGCGNGTGAPTNNAVTGSSPVPVRLITPP